MISGHVGCNLNGTLIDTFLVLQKTYEYLGVTGWKEDVPWQSFTTLELHLKKHEVYPELLKKYGKPLPLMQLADEQDWDIITGSSQETIHTLKRVFGLRLLFAHTGICSISARVAEIKRLGLNVYIDNDPIILEQVTKKVPGCQVLLMTTMGR
jgi:hypothetical protein